MTLCQHHSPDGVLPGALNLARGPTDNTRRMTTFHRVFTAAIVALALAAVAQAAPSSSSATGSVRATAYVKGGPVGVTVGGDPVTVGEMCKGLFATKGFTRCRAGGSRYQATACAWRITPTSGGTSMILTVTTARAMLAAIRPRVCPGLARYVRGYPGIRAVRLK